jgi:hypothetical protein
VNSTILSVDNNFPDSDAMLIQRKEEKLRQKCRVVKTEILISAFPFGGLTCAFHASCINNRNAEKNVRKFFAVAEVCCQNR